MKHKFSNAELKEAAALVRNSMLEALADGGEAPYTLTPEFEAEIKELQAHHKRLTRRRAIFKRVIAALLVLILGLTLFLSANPEARASVTAWIREALEGKTRFWFQEETHPQTAFPEVEFGWLPEGVECTMANTSENRCSYLFTNHSDTNLGFSLTSGPMVEGSGFVAFYGHTAYNHSTIYVRKYLGELFSSHDADNPNALFWFDEENSIYFGITSFYSTEIILRIAENIKLIIPTK